MSSDTAAIFHAALALPAENKAELAQRLLDSLEDADQAEVDRAWVEEIDRRLKDYADGKINAIPAEQVFEGIFSEKKQ